MIADPEILTGMILIRLFDKVLQQKLISINVFRERKKKYGKNVQSLKRRLKNFTRNESDFIV